MEADIADFYASIRPQLRLTQAARRNVVFGFVPPMPRWVRLATPARTAWIALMALAVAMLPRWTRRLYGLPGLPTTDLAADLHALVLREVAALTPWSSNPTHRAALGRLGVTADRG